MLTDSPEKVRDADDIPAAQLNMVRRIAAWAHKIHCGSDMKTVISIDDLYHTGIIGLLEARQNPDPERNLDAYLAIRVRGSIIDMLRKQLQVRVPRDQWRQVKMIQKAKDDILRSGKVPSADAVARHLGWPLENVHKALDIRLRIVPVTHEKEPSNGNNMPPGHTPADPSPTPEECILKEDLALVMQKCLESIKERMERIILICRMLHQLELKMLAKVMGFSIEGIRQKEIRAKKSMKQCLESAGWSKDSLK